jgi:DNA invertase Pin-like site-specific DNA recombinase
MYYYYSRISTVGQNSSRQIANFKAHGHVDVNNVFIDKIQGNVPFFERTEAVKLFLSITSTNAENRTIVIDSIDRLGRNLIDILKTIEVFTSNGINVKSLKEGFQTLIDGKENPMSRIVISVMGSIAEMERCRIKERQYEGIVIAKAEGKFRGRKIGSVQSNERLLERHPIIVQKLKKGLSIRDVAEITKASTTTINKVKKVLEQKG